MGNSMHTYNRQGLLGAAVASLLMLAGCSDNDGNHDASLAMAAFDVTITNQTFNQPFSPVALVLHSDQWRAFSTGEAASEDIERLAEGGENSAFLAAAQASGEVFDLASGTSAIAPGASETLRVEVPLNEVGNISLTALSMLVNTNDALAAVNGADIASFAVGEVRAVHALSYDSGTESNSETADTIPGPAGLSGLREGFSPLRDDVRDAVYVHAGVVTQASGLATSALDETHRWDHSVARIVIERTQ